MWLNITYVSRSISRRFFLGFFPSFLPGELEVLGVQSLSSSHILWTIESCFGGPLREHVTSWRGQRRCVLIMHLVKAGRVACLLEIIHPPCHSPLPQMFHFPSNHYNNCFHWMKNVRTAASHSILKSDSWAFCEMQAFNIIMLIVTHRLALFVT